MLSTERLEAIALRCWTVARDYPAVPSRADKHRLYHQLSDQWIHDLPPEARHTYARFIRDFAPQAALDNSTDCFLYMLALINAFRADQALPPLSYEAVNQWYDYPDNHRWRRALFSAVVGTLVAVMIAFALTASLTANWAQRPSPLSAQPQFPPQGRDPSLPTRA